MKQDWFRPKSVEEALEDMPDEFHTTALAAHEGILAAHFRRVPDQELNTRVGDWLSHEGYRFRIFKHPAHPPGQNDQLWRREPAG